MTKKRKQTFDDYTNPAAARCLAAVDPDCMREVLSTGPSWPSINVTSAYEDGSTRTVDMAPCWWSKDNREACWYSVCITIRDAEGGVEKSGLLVSGGQGARMLGILATGQGDQGELVIEMAKMASGTRVNAETGNKEGVQTTEFGDIDWPYVLDQMLAHRKSCRLPEPTFKEWMR